MPKHFLALLFLLNSLSSFAQNFIGLSSSNYAGSNAIFLNPANAADSRFKLYINLTGLGAEVQNNYVRWNAPYSLLQLASNRVPTKYLAPSGLPLWKQGYFKEISRVKNVKAYVNSEIRGPAVLYANPKYGFGLAIGTRYRLFNSFGHTSPLLAYALTSGVKTPFILHYIPFTDQVGRMNISGHNELYISLAKVLKERGIHFVKVGITGKRLTSNLNLGLEGTDLDYQINPAPTVPEGEDVIINAATGSFYHASDGNALGFNWLLDQMFSVSAVGNGFGADLGFVYEFRPDFARFRKKIKGLYIPNPSINKYKFRLGVSLIDLGFIKYSDDTKVQVSEINNVSTFIPSQSFSELKSTQDFISRVENHFSVNPANYIRSYRVLMPATLNIHADYLIRDGFYLSGVLRQYLLSKKRFGPIGFSGFSVIPRFEKKNLEFTFPVSLDQDYTNLNLGASLRAGPLYFGFDNLTGLMGFAKSRGISFYGGLALALKHRLPEDKQLICLFKEKPYTAKKKGLFGRRK